MNFHCCAHYTSCYSKHLSFFLPYLVPGHLWLLVRSQIIINTRAGDHFAVGYLSFLQMADFAAEALPFIVLLHSH